MSIYSVFMLQEDRKVRGTRVFPSERLAYSLEVRKEPNYSLDPNAGSVSKEWQRENARSVWKSETSVFYC